MGQYAKAKKKAWRRREDSTGLEVRKAEGWGSIGDKHGLIR